MIDKLLSLLMTFILLVLSLFGGNAGGPQPDEGEDTDVTPEYDYYIYDDYIEFSNIQYGDSETNNTVDLFVPRTNSAVTISLALYIHGGSWVSGNKEEFAVTAEKCATEKGIAAATLNYSFINDETTITDLLDDITAALNSINIASSQVAVTIDKVVLYGYFAGAHLSLLYSYSRAAESPIPIAFVVSKAGPTNLASERYLDDIYSSMEGSEFLNLMSMATGIQVATWNFTDEDVQAALKSISPLTYAENAVPTIIAQGSHDMTVPVQDAQELYDALLLNEVRCSYINYPNSGHELGNDPDSEALFTQTLEEYIADYLTQYKAPSETPENPETPETP